METVGDFMEDWLKKWKQELSWQERWDVNGWHKEDDLSEELDDYWGQDDEEEGRPLRKIKSMTLTGFFGTEESCLAMTHITRHCWAASGTATRKSVRL